MAVKTQVQLIIQQYDLFCQGHQLIWLYPADYSKSDGDILKFYKRGEYEGDKEATISEGVVTFGSVTIDLGDTSLTSLDVLNVEYAII